MSVNQRDESTDNSPGPLSEGSEGLPRHCLHLARYGTPFRGWRSVAQTSCDRPPAVQLAAPDLARARRAGFARDFSLLQEQAGWLMQNAPVPAQLSHSLSTSPKQLRSAAAQAESVSTSVTLHGWPSCSDTVRLLPMLMERGSCLHEESTHPLRGRSGADGSTRPPTSRGPAQPGS